MNIRELLLAAIGFAVAVSSSCRADDLASLKAQLAEARTEVRSHTGQYDTQPDGSEAAQGAVAREWSLIEQIAAAELDATMDLTKQPIADGVDANAIPLAGDTWLVSADIDGLGTVLVAKQSDSGFRSVWNIRQLDDGQLKAFPLLATWSVADAMALREFPFGPMRGSIGSLGSDDFGRPLFYLDADYTAQEGNDCAYQLSVWAWDGGKAVPLLMHPYGQTLEATTGLEFRAPFLRLHEKDAFTTFFVSAPEPGRQMMWTALMEGDGVRDLGRKSLVPELDAVDELFVRLLKHLPTESVAAPKVAAFVSDALRNADLYVDSADPDNIYGAVGELWEGEVTHTEKGTILCFSADNLDNLAFTLERKDGGTFVTQVRRVTEQDSGKSKCKYLKM
ncbi:MAG: hypothetical protein ABSD74_07115 [Rhizomicrobium sp.]|jgi:hypothetical protein